jgi:hypothetical protein
MTETTSTVLELAGLALILWAIGTVSPALAAATLGALLIASGYQGSKSKR